MTLCLHVNDIFNAPIAAIPDWPLWIFEEPDLFESEEFAYYATRFDGTIYLYNTFGTSTTTLYECKGEGPDVRSCHWHPIVTRLDDHWSVFVTSLPERLMEEVL